MSTVRAALAAALLFSGLAAAQTEHDFYDPGAIQDIHLELHPRDWQALQENFLDNRYYPAEFRWRNIHLSDVGIRSRGRGSRSGVKPNLRIDFDLLEHKQKFLGLKSTILKANNQDPSLLRERASMAVYSWMGLPAPRETFARLFVNGTYYGVYTLIESIDKDFLKRNFGEDEGYLYEWKPEATGTGFFFQDLGDDPALYSPRMFDPVTREKDPDPAPIVAMVKAVNTASDADFVSQVSKYIDLPKFVSFIAAELYLAETDGFLGSTFGMNNFHTYRQKGSTVHAFTPWDKDNAIDWVERSIWDGVEQNVLTRRLLRVPEYRNMFLDELLRAAEVSGGVDGPLETLVKALYDQIAEEARRDPFKLCTKDGTPQPCTIEQFESGVEWVRDFARRRADIVRAKVQESR